MQREGIIRPFTRADVKKALPIELEQAGVKFGSLLFILNREQIGLAFHFLKPPVLVLGVGRTVVPPDTDQRGVEHNILGGIERIDRSDDAADQ
jgi:hypothetical protein